MKRLGLGLLGMLAASLAGCSATASFDPLPSDVCAKQHTSKTTEGDEIVVCDALYTEAPFVHLPALGKDRAFAGIAGRSFVTADGTAYVATGIGSEDKRHAVALYEVALDGDVATDFQPVLQFDESTFLAPFLGRSFEGVIARGTGNDTWADEPSLPVRIDVQAAPIDGGSEHATYEARATIGNLGASVTASDGSCMPSLASYGAEAPFQAGTNVELGLYRVASMHDFGDDHFVMVWTIDGEFGGTLMGPQWYRGPIDIVRGKLGPDVEYEGMGHGTPGAIPGMNLQAANVAAGEACER